MDKHGSLSSENASTGDTKLRLQTPGENVTTVKKSQDKSSSGKVPGIKSLMAVTLCSAEEAQTPFVELCDENLKVLTSYV